MTSSSLDLCLDPFDVEYPGLVREMLEHVGSMGAAADEEKTRVMGSITEDGYCYLIWNKLLYLWSCNETDNNMPHAFKLQLPSTGLNYNVESVCVYRKAKSKLPSVLAISPEGVIRHWTEVGKPHKDQMMELNSEVAFSVRLWEAKTHVHRFIFSTTTCTFYTVEVFHEGKERAEHVIYRPLELHAASSLSRRMSALLFGSQTVDRDRVTRVLLVSGELSYPDADILAIYPRLIRVYSVHTSSLLFDLPLTDMATAQLSKKLDVSKRHLHVWIVDALPLDRGLISLMAVGNTQTDELTFYLGYNRPNRDPSTTREFDSLVRIVLPERSRYRVPDDFAALPKAVLQIPTENECMIVSSQFVILARNPTSPDADTIVLQDIDANDTLLGTASFDGVCHLILMTSGICALRRLPKHFILSFWKSYHTGLQHTGQFFGEDLEIVWQAFLAFCRKDLGGASETLERLDGSGLVESVISLAKFFLDRTPPNDNRWGGEKAVRRSTDRVNRSVLILTQLNDKLAHYRMLVLFLRFFGLIDKLNQPLAEYHNRSGTSVLSEFGEKLHSTTYVYRSIAEYSMPFVDTILKALGKEFGGRFGHPNHPLLDYQDHLFKEVTSFHELVPALVRGEEQELEEYGPEPELRGEVIRQVSSVLTMIADAVGDCRAENWSVPLTETGVASWLNQPLFLANFIRHLNLMLDFLETIREDAATADYRALMEQALCIAKFVLGEQHRWQRDNSQIIAKFYEIGEAAVAIDLAETYEDFTMLIRHCHTQLDEQERRQRIDQYKRLFADKDFDLFLYEYYRKNGMIKYLLEERGERVDNFLCSHEDINWIRNVERREYKQASAILKNMAFEAKDATKKATVLALGQLCALCEDEEDPAEIAEFTDAMKLLTHQEKIHKDVQARLNPSNRPLTAEEIVDADLAEESLEGYLKALLVVATLYDSTTANAKPLASHLKARVYTAVLKRDEWAKFPTDGRFAELSGRSAFIALNRSVLDMELPADMKKCLLPEVGPLARSIKLPSHIAPLFEHFLVGETEALELALKENERPQVVQSDETIVIDD
ncbi:CRE-NPP-15 protein [Aphelenchoides avenae]|nr:CRE-NPP-15 protein [Aphelenchus avenae]